MHDPTDEEWKRFRRYASWIRVLFVDLELEEEYANMGFTPLLDLVALISTKPTQQAMFPNLRDLTWYGEPSSLTYLPSFMSPILTDLRINIKTERKIRYLLGEYAPLELAINSTISPLNLRSLRFYIPPEANPSPGLKRGAADSTLRCGSALTALELEFELPESVVLHLKSLPNLAEWRATQPAASDAHLLTTQIKTQLDQNTRVHGKSETKYNHYTMRAWNLDAK